MGWNTPASWRVHPGVFFNARSIVLGLNFDAAGIAGLVPKKPGPRGPNKIDSEV